MAFFSAWFRASLLLLVLLAAAPRAGAAAAIPGQASSLATTASQEPAAGQKPAAPAAPPQLTLQLGPLQLHYVAHFTPTLLDRLLFGSRAAALARQLVRENNLRLPF